MNKPQIKREVQITTVIKSVRHIIFYASTDAVAEFEEFGEVLPSTNTRELYNLFVDARYDFGEVVAYIEGYGTRGM
jgi:hypothetical protein